MRTLGARLGAVCAGGDVIILSGELGAGKTTITQGIGSGLGIVDAITSPTFVIARVHSNPGGGPDLIHVDAYRLGSLAEVDDLDLESDLDRSVVVVEWGDGIVDDLSPSRLVVRISRLDDGSDDGRVVELVAEGGHWTAAELSWTPQ
ncbi:MAG: tRNA (adenosine(37)-N6)-threonylcarbamoyltransferase complex ATPase subunit type 1 TsaE [bacterium]|nr:tRNA (adenosine(37)-N6)-threonylcarbamoyltransferase complex ATPase subunit type 1 TsaE [bacterium]